MVEEGSRAGFEVADRGHGIWWIELNRPDQLNGMNQAMKRDLVEVCTAIRLDAGARVVVFTGLGRAFSAGDDVTSAEAWHGGAPTLVPELGPGAGGALGTYNGLRAISQALNQAVRSLDTITIAAINGPAIQAGLSLALSCDFRIASRAARLGSATLRWALLPDEGGHWLVVRLLGVARSLEFFLRNRILSADEALAWGLVTEVVEPEDLDAATMALAEEFARAPQLATRLLKRAVYQAAESSFDEALEDIAIRAAATDHSPDVAEGIAALREKRRPSFG